MFMIGRSNCLNYVFGLGIFVGVLFRESTVVLSQTLEPDVCDSERTGEGISNPASTGYGQQGRDRKLRPSDLPQPQFFDDFHSRTTLRIADRELTVLKGSIPQQGRMKEKESNIPPSKLAVIPELVPRSVIAEILTLLRGNENADVANGRTTIALDQDPDSVDGMTSQEIFLDNDNLRSGQTSKSDPYEDMETRGVLRQKLMALTEEYSKGLLMPFLEEWYGKKKCGLPGRRCTPCYSLIRRYRAGERQSHAPHHDAHSFVTVVVSLTDYGEEYTGGLYVSTKNSERNYIKLNRGDAVVHQQDLHHGVRVLDERDDGGPSERWSWILWFRDSDTCEDHYLEWHTHCSKEGDPTCMYLRANAESDPKEKILWNRKASDSGHSQASVKMAYAYLKFLPSEEIEYNRTKASELFGQAIESSNDPDGHYGMATLYLNRARISVLQQPDDQSKQRKAIEVMTSPLVAKAIEHLEEAARGGHAFAMFNLGISHTFGYASEDHGVDYELAAEWFEASGLPEGLAAKAMYLGAVGKQEEMRDYQQKAMALGYGAPWRRPARERTGSGGSSGPKLNLDWPPLPNGLMPPEW